MTFIIPSCRPGPGPTTASRYSSGLSSELVLYSHFTDFESQVGKGVHAGQGSSAPSTPRGRGREAGEARKYASSLAKP